MRMNDVRKSERGIALLELAVTVPVLVYMVMSSINLASWILDHNRVNTIAYELARYAATYEGLEECNSADSCAILPGHAKIIQRGQSLLTQSGFSGSPTIESLYTGSSPLNADSDSTFAVRIHLSVPVQPVLSSTAFFVPINTVSATVVAPYVWRDPDA